MLVLSFIIILFITSCSQRHSDPEAYINKYISEWNDEEFSKMYHMIDKNNYTEEDFIERYEKIYHDIKVKDLKVTYDSPEKKSIKLAIKEKKPLKIPIKVSLNSLAGPITFEDNLHVIFQSDSKKDTKPWVIDWNPDLIFPGLNKGGKIFIEHNLPKRGDILDRNQMPLALSDTAYEIGIIPQNLVNESQEKQQMSNLLNIPVSKIDEQLNAKWVENHLFVPLKKVSSTNTNVLNQLANIPGSAKNEINVRTYPLEEAAAHLVGYIGNVTAEDIKKDTSYKEGDSIGKRGLEQLFEKDLKGTIGTQIKVVHDAEEDLILANTEAINGENITLTIDVNIQEKIFNAFETRAGTAAAIDPKTGDILALISSPAFNPNDLLFGLSQNQWDALQNNPKMPLINRFASTYAPGSVIKPITAAVGLDNKTLQPNAGIEINGLKWGKNGWGNSKVTRVSNSYKPVDLNDALVRSDNIYFAMQAINMGEDKFIEGFSKFGFGKEIPMAYPITPSEVSRDGKLPNEILLAHSSYGQGELEVSALHLASTYSAILNKGTMLKPRLLSTDKEEVWQDKLITEENAKILQKDLRDVITKGTGKVAEKADFPIAGKTGTAELKLSLGSRGSENGWFVGYPDDKQNIIIAMMMENVQDEGASFLVTEKVTDILIDLRKEKIHSD